MNTQISIKLEDLFNKVSEYSTKNITYSQTNLEDFVIQNQIGHGSFGKVYKVQKKQTHEIYAAKI